MLNAMVVILLLVADAPAKPTVVVVVGAPGAVEYAPQFHEWSERWRVAAEKGGAEFVLVGEAGGRRYGP